MKINLLHIAIHFSLFEWMIVYLVSTFAIAMKLNRWKILKYITLRHNLIFCHSSCKSFSFLPPIFLSLIFFFSTLLSPCTILDSAFTERILGLPNENFKGYVEADATQRARHIPSHSYFLIHGLADSSAPYLHGTQLARALAKAGVIFQYQVRR